MAFSVEGKSVIVTGAADGVGLAVARRFAELDARVMLAGADEEALSRETAALEKAGAQVVSFAGDLKQKLAQANLISATIDAFEGIDILVNAGRRIESTDPLDPGDTSLDAMFEHNVLATLRLSQAVARKMIKLAGDRDDKAAVGSIVNITSIAARRTLPELIGYSVSSAALDQLTRSLAVAFAQHRIRVNAVALGSVMSSTLRTALKERDDLQEELAAATPLGRIGEASEAADVAVFLGSESASFVTGQIVAVDGGRTMLDPMDTPVH